LKVVVALAIVIGIVAGVGFAVIQNSSDQSGNSPSTASAAEATVDPRKELSAEVLKALPDEELAEIFPEKAESILNPQSAEQIKVGSNKLSDPAYLRAVLEKMGANPPADATTSELQEMLAHIEASDTSLAGK
jgi:hypothetical protein